eukprot:scaffold45886_cov39-Prasinocladus_malaysianus.AAC.2
MGNACHDRCLVVVGRISGGQEGKCMVLAGLELSDPNDSSVLAAKAEAVAELVHGCEALDVRWGPGMCGGGESSHA